MIKAVPWFLMAWLVLSGGLTAAPVSPWRSALYPENWRPGFSDASGRYLNDYSYAGYARGEKPIPTPVGPVFDVTQAPYSADASGAKDSTSAIQAALDHAAVKGGGVVYLPAGTYRVAPPEGADRALWIRGDNIVLRGAGTGKTFLLNTSTSMRFKKVIEIRPDPPAFWYAEGEGVKQSPSKGDIPVGSLEIPVENAAMFKAGDIVVVRNDMTDRFIEFLGMTGKWTRENTRNRGLAFCRRVVSVDAGKNIVRLDVPTHYPLLKVDGARVVLLAGKWVRESGVEDLSVGMLQHAGTSFGDLDYKTEGTAAYDVHQATVISIEGAENCWVRRVDTYKPKENTLDIHILSHGIKVWRSRLVTVEECRFHNPQYLGEGGNGYHFILQANDCLLQRSEGHRGRHNFSFGSTGSSGNVVLEVLTKDPRLAADFHMHFSVANLLDSNICDGDFLEAKYRPYGGVPEHGVTTSQSVFWNTRGLKYPPLEAEYSGKKSRRPQIVVLSEQFGEGYVIGTQGPASAVQTDDFQEGIGQGEGLQPASLYRDQLRRRLEGMKAAGGGR